MVRRFALALLLPFSLPLAWACSEELPDHCAELRDEAGPAVQIRLENRRATPVYLARPPCSAFPEFRVVDPAGDDRAAYRCPECSLATERDIQCSDPTTECFRGAEMIAPLGSFTLVWAPAEWVPARLGSECRQDGLPSTECFVQRPLELADLTFTMEAFEVASCPAGEGTTACTCQPEPPGSCETDVPLELSGSFTLERLASEARDGELVVVIE